MKAYIGVDVGSVSTNVAIINDSNDVLSSAYIRTHGRPIEAVQKGLRQVADELDGKVDIEGAGTTGSGRHLTGILIGADVMKNEITAHAVSAVAEIPNVQTIFEIGGQDSKFILLRDGVVMDFAMNNVCAAGTGSFLDQQSARLGIPIEEFGSYAIMAKSPARIAGRCTVFAESDMIHKQQMGHSLEDIIAGLCEAMVRNYLNNVVKGKEVLNPIVFQGGVAANIGIKSAFEKAIGMETIVPAHYSIMGAIGAGILARAKMKKTGGKTNFKGFQTSDMNYRTSGFECDGCSNRCEIINMLIDNKMIARWGGRCKKWEYAEKPLVDI
jgi:predicted CoA-substrate-specific enzyme activase